MTTEIENTGSAIVRSVCNSEIKDVAVDVGELGLGVIFDSEILKEIPAIKTIIACRKTWESIHDQLFLRKVQIFLSVDPKFSTQQGEQFLKSLDENTQAKKLFESIVLILDRIDDMEKPIMLKKAFAPLVRKEIEYETFRRIAAAIQNGFLEDLKELSSLNYASPVSTAGKVKPQLKLYFNLMQTGLTGPKNSSGTTMILGVSYQITELGKVFIKCMSQ